MYIGLIQQYVEGFLYNFRVLGRGLGFRGLGFGVKV